MESRFNPLIVCFKLFVDAIRVEFADWMKEFLYICKVALKEQTQLLESLGIRELSTGYTR
ncbi:MAG TPA: hypothetical protein VK186_14500 [Candidatus Deferrimicrobium sp.]|nr:hypothetical protein [Candidatus Deferrimicrobium sp.]